MLYSLQSIQLPDEIEVKGTDELTLPQFLLLVFKVPEETEENIMENIGIKGSVVFIYLCHNSIYSFLICL